MTRTPNLAPGLEPDTRKFLEALAAGGGPPLETLSPAEARQVLEGAQASVKVELAPAEVEHLTVDLPVGPVRLVLVRPAGVKGTLPGFVFIHGGGWILGDYPTHERFVRDVVAASGAAAVFVDYDRSPEVRYPVALEQCFAATRWVAEHGHEHGIDGRRLAVVGNSVGGDLTAAVVLKAKEQGGPKLAAQVLFWPVTDADLDTASYLTYAEDHFLTRNLMRWMWDSYLPDPTKRRHHHVSPLQATLEQLRGLPPTLVITAEADVLRDEGEAYGRKLAEAGVTVTTTRYLGMIHDFGLLNPLAHLAGTRAAMRQAGAELRRWLG